MTDWLLRLISKEVIIRFILKWIAGISDGSISEIIDKIRVAGNKVLTGAEKYEWVLSELREIWDEIIKRLGNSAVRFIIELVVAWLKKTKAIK